MGWTSILLAYVLGGFTFIPLVLVAILLHFQFTAPYRPDLDIPLPPDDPADALVQPGDDVAAIAAGQATHKEEAKHKVGHETDVAAGYFAVCREYTPMGINAKPIERSTPVGSATVAAPSPSVYQTMYRSLFDRKQTPGPLDNANGSSQRPKKAGNVFYVVLRHGHLMLFDDDEQLEVRHVISLAHHDISIFSGGDVTPEGELYIKRNALCLSRRNDGLEVGPDNRLSKPFYLFSENCSAKEDFYFALLRNQEQTFAADRKSPKPVQFEVQNIISLVQKLHSTDEHIHTRWLNAFLGRIFLGVYKTRDLESYIIEKITKKISRVKRPSFLSNISIRRIDTGDAAPYVTNPRMRDLTVEGECVAEADVRYTGNFRIEVAAIARIDLGARFKVREVNLVLAVVVRKVEGHVLFKIKPPPSNRVWFSFQTMPKMEMTIEPIVSSRQITYTLILRQIENRIKEVICESVVQPFWDDVPFFKTEHKKWRGGIFEGDDAVLPSDDPETAAAKDGDVDAVDRMEAAAEASANLPPIEKSHSFPVMENTQPTGLFGRKITPKSPASPSPSATSTSVSNSHGAPAASWPRRPSSAADIAASPRQSNVLADSLTPPDSVMTAAGASPVGSPAKPPAVFKRPSNSSLSSSSREAVDHEHDQERTPTVQERRNTASSTGSNNNLDDSPTSAPPAMSIKASLKSQTGSLSRGLFRRENSTNSTSGASTNGADGAPKRNTLAAVTKAAAQARTWGWNALQRHGDGSKSGTVSEASSTVDLTQPMGRGRPLPPPGTPLPPPDRSQKVTSIPVPKRRPLPPPLLPSRGPSAESEVQHRGIERRSVPPPPLPKRRHIEAPAEDSGDNMLVVEAPEDSEPGSPLREEPPPHMAESAVATASDSESGSAAEAAEPQPHRETPASEIQQPLEADNHEDLEDDPNQGPITAVPVVGDEDDDDGYSGWMDNTGQDDEDEMEPTDSNQQVNVRAAAPMT